MSKKQPKALTLRQVDPATESSPSPAPPAEPDPAPDGPQTPSLLVAIGASAGGLEALEALFGNLPDTAGLAYVVITHLSPDFKSLLDELLARRTRMPVRLVEEGMLVSPNEVYVIPPGKEMIIAGCRLYLSDREANDKAPLPINTFLLALSREWGSRAIAVILSGSGSDGAKGVQQVKIAGGYVLAQSPETAAFDGMPSAAIQTGAADGVVPPADMGEAILGHAQATAPRREKPSTDTNEDHVRYRQIMQLVYGSEDIDFSGYKLTTFRRRISRRMTARSCATLDDYITLLTQDPSEAKHLSDDLLIGVTSFFRDAEAFDVLRTKTIEPLLKARIRASAPLRIWVAGCATGQEAYGIAIMVEDARKALNMEIPVQIFATDIRRDFLEKAGRGIYASHEMVGVPETIRDRYFREIDSDSYQIDAAIRKSVIFAPHDLMRDPPFTKIDLICCRNVLIYFNTDWQERILALFNFAIAQDGLLFLGPSESLGELEQYFVPIDAHWRIFRKANSRTISLSSPPTSSGLRHPILHDPSVRNVTRQRSNALMPAYLAMLKRYGPPCALITVDRQLVHAIGQGRNYLRPPEGAVSLDILELVDPALRAPLATGIERCRRERKDIIFPDLALREAEAHGERVKISIQPLFEKPDSETSHFVVIFESLEGPKAEKNDEVIQLELSDASRERIATLEEDLKRTRESLQASIEEIETSNEELQSSNEELMASNEELQSTNEELSSVNEELHSVNAEYLRQNEKLTIVHRDMESLLRAVDVGVIFVDRDHVIRRFTSGAERLFGLIAEDVGRRIGDLRTQFQSFHATEMITRAINQDTIIESEYQFEDGSWWLMRCVAHDAAHDGAGVVLAAINIDRVKTAELDARRYQDRYGQVLALSKAILVSNDNDGLFTEPQPEWEAFTGQSFEDAKGFGWLDAVHEADRGRIRAIWTDPDKARKAKSSTGERATTYRLWHAESQSWRYVQCRAQYTTAEGGQEPLWHRVILDAEDIIQSEGVRKHNEGILRAVIKASPEFVAYVDNQEVIQSAPSEPPENYFPGLDELVGRSLSEILDSATYAALAPSVEAALAGKPQETQFVLGQTGQTILAVLEPLIEAEDFVDGFALIMRNLSSLRHAMDEDLAHLEMVERLFDRIEDEVILFDPKTLEISFANKRAVNNLRFPAHQMYGKSIKELLPEYSESRLAKLMEQVEPQRKHATFLLRYDGTTYDAQISFDTDRRSDTRHPVGIMIGRDVTEQTAAAAELRDRTADLATSNRDLEQFAFAISHDLKAPLRHITAFAGLLRKQAADSLPPDKAELLDQILDSSGRMRTMIDSLLAYCRIQKSGQFKTVALAQSARDAVANLNDMIDSEDPEIMGIDDLPKVFGDPTLLTMLMQNLIENALKYRREVRPVVTFSAKRGRGIWRIAVTDNGMGIDAAHGEDIFQVFRRLHTSDDDNSTGIGLAACRRIVEIHRGRIWLDTAHSEGARFIFELPNLKSGGTRNR